MRILLDPATGYVAAPLLAAIFVAFLKVAAAVFPEGRGAGVEVRAEEGAAEPAAA